ncbi:hypothetical protein GQ42DRAFT_18707 [Ramicandelaber brevisporus]|nr:hypothetical protein GQ42DRAFT_18707 [Ramicandelaber brevisporus]
MNTNIDILPLERAAANKSSTMASNSNSTTPRNPTAKFTQEQICNNLRFIIAEGGINKVPITPWILTNPGDPKPRIINADGTPYLTPNQMKKLREAEEQKQKQKQKEQDDAMEIIEVTNEEDGEASGSTKTTSTKTTTTTTTSATMMMTASPATPGSLSMT